MRGLHLCCPPCVCSSSYHSRRYFAPTVVSPGYNLAIIQGEDGARLTHSHERQWHFARQSLMLWKAIINDMFRLWLNPHLPSFHSSFAPLSIPPPSSLLPPSPPASHLVHHATEPTVTVLRRLCRSLSESDLLSADAPYSLKNTGQGIQRVQPCPLTYKAMQQLLRDVQSEVDQWIGSSMIHMGGRWPIRPFSDLLPSSLLVSDFSIIYFLIALIFSHTARGRTS